MYTCIYITVMFHCIDPPLASIFASLCPSLHDPPFCLTYLEISLLLLVVRIPIHSCPWLAINCSSLATSPTPRHPTDQVTYLHRRHQQHQLSCLIQRCILLNKSIDVSEGRLKFFIRTILKMVWSHYAILRV
jgi:hypothetical protein